MVLTLHLGAHKTATTHLQASLRAANGVLRERGVHFAGPTVLRTQRCPLTLALSESGTERQAERARRHLADVAEIYPELLISDENIIGGTRRGYLFGRRGQIYPQAAPRLRKLLTLLPNRPVDAVLSIRDPASFLTSAFSLQLNRGMELELDGYLNGRDPTAVDWTDLAARILSLPGIRRLTVWRYEDYRALRPRILSELLPPGVAPLIPDPRPVNVGMSRQGYDWLTGRAMQDAEADLRELAGQARTRFPRSAGHDPLVLLGHAQRRLSARRYAQDVARLRELPGVIFLDP